MTLFRAVRLNRQILSKGNALVVAKSCDQFWDGKMIVPMTDDNREAVLLLNQQWCASRSLARAHAHTEARTEASTHAEHTRGCARARNGPQAADRYSPQRAVGLSALVSVH